MALLPYIGGESKVMFASLAEKLYILNNTPASKQLFGGWWTQVMSLAQSSEDQFPGTLDHQGSISEVAPSYVSIVLG